MNVYEANFDGLIGPTHHYGGLSSGNRASLEHRHQISSPRQAALQGLEKMKRVADLGVRQAVLPPQPRPDVEFLREHGLRGSDAEVVKQAASRQPDLLSIASSASSMWAANAATVSPSTDTDDGRVHLTPANLYSMPHRRRETWHTTKILRRIFHDSRFFHVHDPLAATHELSDEGAANHTRLCAKHSEPGIELFVFGRDSQDQHNAARFTPRQAYAASRQIARQHGLRESQCVFAQQHPRAIDAGVFHNDVISVGNETVHLVHESAFVDQARVLAEVEEAFGSGLHQIEISEQQLTLEEAVATYFFNSQLLSLPDGGMLLLCPIECQQSRSARRLIDRLLKQQNPITDCQFVDLRESMQNGGGPACLRLRVVLTDTQWEAIPSCVRFDDTLYLSLKAWIERHYRETLSVEELGDPKLREEVQTAMEELNGMMHLSESVSSTSSPKSAGSG
jgi:succinylarginine dihydrolase